MSAVGEAARGDRDEDALHGAQWWCAAGEPDAIPDPAALRDADLHWRAASVPGTAAGALQAAGEWRWGEEDEDRLDGRDWWFRVRFARPAGDGPWELRLDGVATLADVWCNDVHLAHHENMFAPIVVGLDAAALGADNELTIRCAALTPRLRRRHPRPRFKSRLVRHQALRWYRTTLLGRMPGWSRWAAPVGPWRPVTLRARPAAGRMVDLRLAADVAAGGGGRVRVAFSLVDGARPPRAAVLDVAGVRAPLTVRETAAGVEVEGEVTLDAVQRWWPHTHGAQPLYAVTVELDGVWVPLRRVGFRTVELDRGDGGFTLTVNGRRCWLRGVTWGAVDAVSLTATEAQVTEQLQLARDAGLNLIRLGGYGVYEDAGFWDACDALGILVWQDCMIAAVDPPDDDAWRAELDAELAGQLGALQGRPSLGLVCGSSETYQQGAMLGLAPERYRSPVLEEHIARRVAERLPGTPYVASSPSGGEPPIRTDEGVCHYFGVGAYLRPPEDARLAGVRFAAECLSFSNPPAPELIERVYGSAAAAGHDPRWKLAVARDAGTAWDFEDVRDHYVRELFAVDPRDVRYGDPEYALDLGRAAIVELVERVLGGWREPDSGCAGAVVLAWRDLWPGAGWGMLDSEGTPKATFHALARASAPRAVMLRDAGLNGLVADVFNDRADDLAGSMRIALYATGGGETEAAEVPVALGPGEHRAWNLTEVLGGFRDLTAAYRFSPSWPDAVLARLTAPDGREISRAVHLPGGPARPRTADVGLRAAARPAGPERWSLQVATERLATFVAIDAPGLRAEDAWFHLAPGERRDLVLRGAGDPHGTVRALNSARVSRITVAAP